MSVEPPVENGPDNELRALWQSQELKGGKMSVAEIRNKAHGFERKIRVRNAIEYSAAVIVLMSFGYQMFASANIYIRAGALLIVLATVFVVYVLHTRGSARNVPEELGLSASLDFHRSSLERQRDLLRSVWRWYLLPFVPGIATILFGAAVRDGAILNQPSPVSEQGAGGLGVLIVAAMFVAFFFFIAAINNRGARKLQAEIDALEKQEGETTGGL
jgi:hypothetical protein